MARLLVPLLFSLASAGAFAAENPVVVIETNLGTIEAELFADKAPVSTANFLRYADDKFYDGTVFHRVIQGFMIQGGGYDERYQRKPTREPIKNEADNGLSNEKYTLAMARTMVVHSATAQFFINTVKNDRLDFQSADSKGYGYAVFGKVVKGQDVVDAIERTPTGTCPGIDRDCPAQRVVIRRVYKKEASPPATTTGAVVPTAAPTPGRGVIVATAQGGECAFAVDGSSKGTSASVRVEVAPGAHKVACVLKTGEVRTQDVTVESGATAQAMFKLN